MKFRTARRVAALVGGISLLLLIVGVSGAWYVRRVERQSSALLEHNVASMRAAEELQIFVSEIRFRLAHFLLDSVRDDLAQAFQMRKDADEWFARIKGLSQSPEEVKILARAEDGLDRLFKTLDELSAVKPDAHRNETIRQLVNEVLTRDVVPHVHELVVYNEKELETSSQQTRRMADRVVLALLVIGTLGALFGLVAGYSMARAISHSIFQLSLPVRDVAGKLGDVVGTISISAEPGLEDLETILNKVSRDVSSVIGQLHERQRELLRADQLAAVGQLAAGLAHELRNPLMCMTVLVQSAISNSQRTLDENDLRVLNEEMARLDRLLQEFLDFARPRQRQMRPVDLRSTIEQTVSLLSGKAQKVSVALVSFLPDEPVIVQGDADQMRQLILNLLLNAMDAIAENGQIDITLTREGDRGEICRIDVADTGSGLTDDTERRLFEPFFSTKDFGLGMGLPICHRIVEEHRGQISGTNRPGGGALFTVRLPAANEAGDVMSIAESKSVGVRKLEEALK